MAQTAVKEQPVVKLVEPEPIDPRNIHREAEYQSFSLYTVYLPEGMTLDDVGNHPKIWSRNQEGANRFKKGDKLLCWFRSRGDNGVRETQREAVVSAADGGSAVPRFKPGSIEMPQHPALYGNASVYVDAMGSHFVIRYRADDSLANREFFKTLKGAEDKARGVTSQKVA